jgi:hypothetical protein
MPIDLEKLTKQDIKNMTPDELNEVLEQALKATDRETKLKIPRALMRYQNVAGLDLEEILEQEIEQ